MSSSRDATLTPAGLPLPLGDPRTEPAGTWGPGRSRRRPALLGGAAALAAALLVGGLIALNMRGDGERAAPPGPPGVPKDTLLVRIDTAPGWARECHARLGTLNAGQPKPEVLLPGEGCDVLPQWSPDKSKIVFTRGAGKASKVMMMNANGDNVHQVMDGIKQRSRVAWSPDGGRLAVMIDVNGTHQLFVVNADGSGRRQLTTDGAAKDDPIWSKDGKLAFWSEKDGTRQIYYLSPDRPAQWTQVTTRSMAPFGANDPRWSPDGKMMAFTVQPPEEGKDPSNGNGDIGVVGADQSGFRRLTNTPQKDMDPQWSPKGDWLAFVRGPTGTPQIFAMRADGSNAQPIGPKGVGHPAWPWP